MIRKIRACRVLRVPEIGYTVESDFIDRTELAMKPGILVLSGLNATMKSVAARTFLVAKPDDEESVNKYSPNFIKLGARVVFMEKHVEIVFRARKTLVPDSRIITRAMLYTRNEIMAILDFLQRAEEPLKRAGDQQTLYYILELGRLFRKVLGSLRLDFVENVYNERGKAPQDIVSEVYKELESVVEGIVAELGDMFKDVASARDAITPLAVRIEDPKKLRLDIRDRRFKKTVRSEAVSTSVIAPLLFDLVTVFLSQPAGDEEQNYGIIVIEEPEENMTPLQQVVFARYLERAVKKSMELTGCEAYVIVTTYSPYIAFAFSKDVPVKYFGYDVSKGKVVVEDKPFKSFAMADVVIAAYAVKGAT